MRLVDEQQEVVGEVVEQRPGRLAGQAPIHMARVVLDARAVAHLAQHLEIVHRALLEPRRLEQLALGLQLCEALGQLGLDVGDRQLQLVGGGDEVLGRVDVDAAVRLTSISPVSGSTSTMRSISSPQNSTRSADLGVGREDLERVAAHAEGAAVEVDIVALELQVDQLAQQLVAVAHLADAQRQRLTWP